VFPLLASILSRKGRKALLSPAFDTLATSDGGASEKTGPFKQRRPLLGIMRRQHIRKCPEVLVFSLELVKKVQNNMPARPSVSLNRAVHRLLLDLGGHPILRPALVIHLLVFILYLQGEIEIDYFQAKCLIHKKVVGFDVPVGDTKPMKIPEAFNEAIAEFIDPARELLRSEPEVIHNPVHFRCDDPQRGLRVEGVD